MNFESDLAHIIKQQFDKHNIFYEDNLDVRSLAARYFEMLNRRITPLPRRVYFSEEIHESLGELTREKVAKQREKAASAWEAVFLIRHLLTEGENVNCFLSKGIDSATGERSLDGLLWDFGMHHFHLSKEVKGSGFVKRSDYLLFAIVAQEDAYFVDVRLHPPRRGDIGWVRQDLLRIMHSNWPELVEPNILRGVKGTELTDEEKQELRRKNVNCAVQMGDNAIAPIGGGMVADGSSLLCRWWALKLLHEIKQHQSFFDNHPAELRSGLEAKGMELGGRMEFKLVLADSLNLSAEEITSLTADQCLSRDLYRMGFVVVEAAKILPIVVSFVGQPC